MHATRLVNKLTKTSVYAITRKSALKTFYYQQTFEQIKSLAILLLLFTTTISMLLFATPLFTRLIVVLVVVVRNARHLKSAQTSNPRLGRVRSDEFADLLRRCEPFLAVSDVFLCVALRVTKLRLRIQDPQPHRTIAATGDNQELRRRSGGGRERQDVEVFDAARYAGGRARDLREQATVRGRWGRVAGGRLEGGRRWGGGCSGGVVE